MPRPSAAVLAEHGVDMVGDSLSKNPWSRDVRENRVFVSSWLLLVMLMVLIACQVLNGTSFFC